MEEIPLGVPWKKASLSTRETAENKKSTVRRYIDELRNSLGNSQ
jgi:hypothetical protein